MKKIFALTITLLVFFSFKYRTGNEYTIHGRVDSSFNGKKVYLAHNNTLSIIRDSCIIEKGKFLFNGVTEAPIACALYFEGLERDNKVLLYLEKGDIKVNVNSKDISQSVVGGTLNNDALEKYRLLLSDTEKKHTAFMEKNSEKARRAEKENDTQTLMKITNEFMALYDEYIDARNSFLEKNPNSIVSADILLETFLESDGISITEIKTSFDKLGADAKESEAGKKLNILINRKLEGQITIKKILDSGKFPDFSGQTPNGKTLTLQQVLGKVTVIYFWASWDEASRERKSELINLYNEFHGKGLTIIGVSLDQDSEKWKNAVKEDKLVWHNISNLKGWDDPIVKKLGIYSIPSLIVLDKNGKLRFQSYAYWDEEIKINIIGLLDE